MTLDLTKLSLLGSGSGKGERPHPLDALTPAELELGVELIKAHVASEHPGATPWFKHLTLLEPPKAELVPWLLKSREGSVDPLDRRGTALISLKLEHKTVYTEYVVSLSAKSVIKTRTTEDTDHAPFDVDEMLLAEQILLKDPEFIKVVDKLKLPQGAQILADSWPYGADKAEHNPRWIVFMCYFRLSSDPDSNHYSLPLPFIPAIDPHTMKLVAMNFTPIFGGESTETIEDLWAKGENFPWEKLFASEYKHDLQAASSRPELKPYQVVQPEGPSFQVDGQKVTWQNWDFRIGFNFREGVTLHDVKYQGRDTFHRLSISDMTVPYGDPRTPYHRKQAFDLGDVGAGICANELSLGCDCLGTIHYFSANFINSKGHVQHQKNVVCLHEQDEGLGWKHTHYRTGNASVTRNRVLVVQMVITVANYEYVFAWKLDQAANIHLETRATGILSTHLIMPGETSPYGNIVNPGVLAPNHQHLFSIRIDPAIGALGEGNTVIQEDSVPMPFDRADPPANNPWGVGYTVEKTVIEKSGWADAAPFKNRVFKIVNPSRINPVSQRPISYKLVPQPSQLMLCHPDSVGYARAEFGGHHIWVTKHRDNELYSGGEYTNQSTGNAGGIKTWVARDDTVENEDLVLWHTFGLTHNPRVEDFPVMPCETHMLSLKPADFFTTSPAIDVPSSTQAFNKSVLTTNGPNGTNGSANGAGATNGSCCQK